MLRIRPAALVLLGVFLPFVVAFPIAAQRRPAERDVADVADRYMRAMWAEDWAGAAALVDETQAMPLRAWIVREVERWDERERAFRAYRDSLDRMLRDARTRDDTARVRRTMDRSVSIVRSSGDAPPPRLAFDSALARRHAAVVLPTIDDSLTLGALLALPDREFLARVLQGAERPRRTGVPAMDSMPREPPPSLDQVPHIGVVGVATEGDSVAHALWRMRFPDGEWIDVGIDEIGGMQPEILQLRRRRDGWRVRMTEEQVRKMTTWMLGFRARDRSRRSG